MKYLAPYLLLLSNTLDLTNALAATKPAPTKAADVWLVGCGAPKRGMGWYHAQQLLDDNSVPSGRLAAVVEPWFLGAGADSPPGQAFKAWADDVAKNNDVAFHDSVGSLHAADGARTLALISGRTADNPRLLREVIDAGCSAVFLEKPGAPTVAELEGMRDYAASKKVDVYMGYNKNVTPYVRKALEAAKKVEGSSTTYVHNNAYKPEELPECFERNAEGLLKNMAIHELALLATYWGVTVDNIASVTPDAAASSCQTLKGPSGDEFTDLDKVSFTVETKDGTKITLKIDRCGSDAGGNSIAIVSDAQGAEVYRAETPRDDTRDGVSLEQWCAEAAAKDPEMMPYFFLQSDDYKTLKELSCAQVLSGAAGAPEGMASIDVAIDALKVAEYLTPLLTKALL